MSIVTRKKEITELRLGKRTIIAVYKYFHQIYSAFSKIWRDKTVWKDNAIWKS